MRLLTVGLALSASLLPYTLATQFRSEELASNSQVIQKINELENLSHEGNALVDGSEEFTPERAENVLMSMFKSKLPKPQTTKDGFIPPVSVILDSSSSDDGFIEIHKTELPTPTTTVGGTITTNISAPFGNHKSQTQETQGRPSESVFIQKNSGQNKMARSKLDAKLNTGVMETLDITMFLQKSSATAKQEVGEALTTADDNGDLTGATPTSEQSTLYNETPFLYPADALANYNNLTSLSYEDFLSIANLIAPDGQTIEYYLQRAQSLDTVESNATARDVGADLKVPFTSTIQVAPEVQDQPDVSAAAAGAANAENQRDPTVIERIAKDMPADSE